MSSVDTPTSPSPNSSTPCRPKFNTQNTQDRLRESDQRPSMFNSIKKNRKSVFREVGLASEDAGTISPRIVLKDPFELNDEKRSTATTGLGLLDTGVGKRGVTASSTQEDDTSPDSTAPPHPTSVSASQSESTSPQSATNKTPWYVKLTPTGRRARVRVGSSAPPSPFFGVTTMTMLAVAVAIIAPTLLGKGGQDAGGVVDAGPILVRADVTDVCARWAQQSEWTLPIQDALVLVDMNEDHGGCGHC